MSQLLLRYEVKRTLPWLGPGVYASMSPDILVDWKQDADNKLTLPIGLGLGKLWMLSRTLALSLEVEGHYMAVHPDDIPGRRWNARILFRLQQFGGSVASWARTPAF